MAFNFKMKRLVLKKSGKWIPCQMCGASWIDRDAAHIIDQKEWKKKVKQDSVINGIALCPNCHRAFDVNLRPRLFRALEKYGSINLPGSWESSSRKRAQEDD